jgi:hypothetical protein
MSTATFTTPQQEEKKSTKLRNEIKKRKDNTKLKKSVRKRLRGRMRQALLGGNVSHHAYTGDWIYTATREDIDTLRLEGIEPGMKFLIPIKILKLRKAIQRLV